MKKANEAAGTPAAEPEFGYEWIGELIVSTEIPLKPGFFTDKPGGGGRIKIETARVMLLDYDAHDELAKIGLAAADPAQQARKQKEREDTFLLRSIYSLGPIPKNLIGEEHIKALKLPDHERLHKRINDLDAMFRDAPDGKCPMCGRTWGEG